MFFARRMRQYKQDKSNVSSRIINIATVAVAIGVSAILIAVSTSQGLQREIQKKTSVFNGQILVTLFENNESQVSLQSFKDDLALRDQILNMPTVERIHSVALKAGMLKANQEFEGVLFKGVSQNFQWESISEFLTQGVYPELAEEASNEILISEIILTRLGLSLGDSVNAFFQNESGLRLPKRRKFKVVGVYSSGFPDIDQSLVYLNIQQIQVLNNWQLDQIGGYEVFVDEFNLVNETADLIYNKLPSELNSIPIQDRYSSIFKWIALFDFNVAIILIIMILVGVINMATALLVLILERSRMVGVLKALGSNNALIQKIFLYNALLIISKGLFWGNLIGLGFYFSQSYLGWIKLDPITYFVTKAPVFITLMEVVVLNLFFLSISLVLLWIPSQIILRISPSKVLRYQ